MTTFNISQVKDQIQRYIDTATEDRELALKKYLNSSNIGDATWSYLPRIVDAEARIGFWSRTMRLVNRPEVTEETLGEQLKAYYQSLREDFMRCFRVPSSTNAYSNAVDNTKLESTASCLQDLEWLISRC